MERRVLRERRIVLTDDEGALDNLGQALAAPARDETRRNCGVSEVDCDRVIRDAAKASRRDHPAIRPSILIELGVNAVEPSAETSCRNRDPDPYREPTFGICDHDLCTGRH